MKRPLLLSLFSLLLFFSSSLAAQLEPPSTGGVPALMRELSKLGHYERVLMIGAHPDDEDTELLMILSRGEGAETAYLSLTRGEGGQNLIGPELGDALGILRTEELLAARRIDGSQQFFTRAYDFGFSKTIDDAWKHWPQDSVLKDVVRIIRRFRPQIVVSVFSGTPRDGHGQHQVAGWAAKKAFEVAGDSTRFPELWTEEHLAPWTPLKLYRSARFDTASTVVSFDGGAIDPVTGKTYRQLAMAGRSLHRSQKMGQLQLIGPSTARVTLWEDRTGKGAGGFWAGIDTTLAGWPSVQHLQADAKGRAIALLARYADRVHSAREGAVSEGENGRLHRIVEAFHLVRCAIVDCQRGTDSGETIPVEIVNESAHVESAMTSQSHVLFDAIAVQPRVAIGDTVDITTIVSNTGDAPITATWAVTSMLGIDPVSGRESVGPKQAGSTRSQVVVPSGETPTTPYFLRVPRSGSFYVWPRSFRSWWGLPFAPADLSVWAGMTGVGDSDLTTAERELTFRTNDPASGEIRRPVFIVPRVSIKLTPDEILLPLGKGSITFKVILEHGARDTTSGEVRLELPDGWQKATPKPFTLT
ncbi:MAG: PIG-L family deacetylase, partial [Gemmatimonadales bacterium]